MVARGIVRVRVLVMVLVIVIVIVIVRRGASADDATLPEGHVALSLTAQAGLSKGHAGDPISLAPDVWYGVTGRIQVGLVTSLQGRTGFWSGAGLGVAGSGVCLSGRPTNDDLVGCYDLVENGGVEGSYAIRPHQVLTYGYYVFESDPYRYQMKGGMKVRRRWNHVSAGLSANMLLGSTANFFFPIEVGWNLGDRAVLAVQSGWQQYDKDTRAVPVALGGIVMLSSVWVVAASFSFDRIWGYEGPDPFDQRSASLMVGTML